MARLPVEKLFRKANLAARKGNIDDAKAIYKHVLKFFPNNKKARSELAILEVKKFDGLEKVSQSGAVNQLSKLFMARKYGLVVQQAYTLTRIYPKNHNIWTFLGGALQACQENEKAAIAFSRVVQLKPNYPEGHNNLGTILQALGKIEEAVVSYQKACKLKTDYADAHYNMGNALRELG